MLFGSHAMLLFIALAFSVFDLVSLLTSLIEKMIPSLVFPLFKNPVRFLARSWFYSQE